MFGESGGKKPVRVLVVDDSAFMRKVVSDIIGRQPDLEVVGTARDGLDALGKIESLKPDVITLDVEMPSLDGLGVLRQMATRRLWLPVVMLSSVTQDGSHATLEALSLGAVDFVAKPSGAISLDIKTVAEDLVRKVRAAVNARAPLSGAVSLAPSRRAFYAQAVTAGNRSKRLVVIGASTGGPRALEAVIKSIPGDLPAGILIVQHMPPGFTASLAKRLDSLTTLTVKEAQEGDVIKDRNVLIAPGSYHMLVKDKRITLNQDPPVHFVRPAIDPTMFSAIPEFGSRIVGVVLTGMGRDGADGMAAIKRSGGRTIVQDKDTATIYSMPKAVADEGNADAILPLEAIGQEIYEMVLRV